MLSNLNGFHLHIVLAVILVVFGAATLPALAKSLRQSARVFRGEMQDIEKDSGELNSSGADPRPAPLKLFGS
ncbi:MULTISPECIES: twin-arginine translocase TatA/TatE family subunit [Microbacterium]|uniref:twin-arginine translocase TatA/TatE family subunit n=1 Tax=Microbacterium TaxID=33882 RepID=UPI001430AC3B|nr:MULTISPECIES: twin-arginine translocase TatA/TatE family subunit [Microbacterium]MCK6068511.1 twin-arginine translocase TatA/TatE family subunit [Microbacterium sp. EYE_512]